MAAARDEARRRLDAAMQRFHEANERAERAHAAAYASSHAAAAAASHVAHADLATQLHANVLRVDLGSMTEPVAIATGDPVLCARCGAAFSALSARGVSAFPIKRWRCEFCAHDNDVDIDAAQVPASNSIDYLGATAAAKSGSILMVVVDVSGSMGSGRLEAVTRAAIGVVEELECTAPHTRVGLISFNNQVTVHHPHTVVSGDVLNSFDGLVAAAAAIASPLELSASRGHVLAQLRGLRANGGTALGPGALIGIAMAGKTRGSRVLLCTDGEATDGVGALSSPGDFYTRAGALARDSGVMVDVIGVEGQCRLELLSPMCDLSEGQVSTVRASDVSAQMTAAARDDIAATDVIVTALVHRAMRFVAEDGSGAPSSSSSSSSSMGGSKTVRPVGNARRSTRVSIEYVTKANDEVEALGVDVETLREIPIQVQVEYTRRDGSKHRRVLTDVRRVTTDLSSALGGADMELLGRHVAAQSASMAVRGDYERSRATLQAWSAMTPMYTGSAAQATLEAELHAARDMVEQAYRGSAGATSHVLQQRFSPPVTKSLCKRQPTLAQAAARSFGRIGPSSHLEADPVPALMDASRLDCAPALLDGDQVVVIGRGVEPAPLAGYRGSTWRRVCERAPWAARNGFGSCIVRGKLVVFGGDHGDFDAWESPDRGTSWQKLPATGITGTLHGFGYCANREGAIFVIGGTDGSGPKAEVRRSDDGGRSWRLVHSGGSWSARYGLSVVCMPSGELVLMGGHDGSHRLNDVWVSADGGSGWSLACASAPWSARSGHKSVCMADGAIALMGGFDDGSGYKKDVWSSRDAGRTWVSVPGVRLSSASAVETPASAPAGSGDSMSVWLARLPSSAELLQAFAAGHPVDLPRVWPLDVCIKTPDANFSLLHFACWNGDAGAAIDLLARGADVDAQTDDGSTPLHLACSRDRADIAVTLIGRGANIASEARDGSTPLHLACWHGNARCVEALVDRGADPRAAAVDGSTPLHVACSRGHTAIAAMLIDRGAAVNAKSRDGATPLILAMRGDHDETATMLMRRGASMDDEVVRSARMMSRAADDALASGLRQMARQRSQHPSSPSDGRRYPPLV